MTLSAYAKLPKSSCFRQRGHRLVHANSRCLASTTRANADQKQEWVYQLFCRALWRCSKHDTSPFNHWQWPHVRLLPTGKKKLLQKVITDPEARELVGWWVRLRSSKTKSKLVRKRFFSCPESILRMQVLILKISTVRHPSDDDTLKHHLERTYDITYWLIHYDLSFSYWPWLGTHEWEVPTISPHSAAVTSSGHLVTAQTTATMRAAAVA